jgi:MFS superfamily sulfate permease-like transporter
MLILRPEEPLFFANAESVLVQARHRVEAQQGLRRVILSLEESPDLDGTVLEALGDFATWLDARSIELRVARLKDEARDALMRMALPQLPPQALDDWSVEDAVLAPSPTSTSDKGNS